MYLQSSAAALVLSFFTSVVLAENTQDCLYEPVWNTCLSQDDSRVQCASFNVPADWTNQSAGDISLNLIRYAAVDANNNIDNNAESVIMNPGGPGSRGIEHVLDGGEIYYSGAGQRYHIVSFDPRGVGVNGAYKCVSNVTSPTSSNYSDPDILQQIYEGAVQLAADCNSQYGSYGKLIGTVAAARDVRAIAQAVGVNTKLIRFWGFSYGTVLGDTIARLFPDEIAGMVLDGNINPNDYYLQFPIEEASNIDAAIYNFFDLCAATTQTNCAWTTSNATSADLVSKWDNWVGADPFQVNRGRTSNLTIDQSFYVRYVMFQGILRGFLFQKCAQVLQSWYENPSQIEPIDLTKYELPLSTSKRNAASEDVNGNFNPADSESAVTMNELLAITGSDNQFRPGNLDGATYADWLVQYNAKSKYAGEFSINNLLSFAPWIPQAAEYFTTEFANIHTSKEILFVQTPYDPVTPNISGIAAHDAFTNSVIVFTDGVGHCSSSQTSTSLEAAIALYWTDGTVPKDQTNYAVDNPNPFIKVPAEDNTDEDIDDDANQQTPDSQTQRRRKRSADEYLSMWPKRDVDSNPAPVGVCNNHTTTTTSSTTSATSTSSTLATRVSTSSNTRRTSITTNSVSTSRVSLSSSSAPWSSDEADQSSSWAPWSNQPDNIPVTKTSCSVDNCQTSIVAVPTVTTYVIPMLSVCETGLTTSTVTVTTTCPSGCDGSPTGVPQGYTTTQIWCSACNIPSTVTVTIPLAATATATSTGKSTEQVQWSTWAADGTSRIPGDSSKTTSSTGSESPSMSGLDSWTAWTTDAFNSSTSIKTGPASSSSSSKTKHGTTSSETPADISAKSTQTGTGTASWSAWTDGVGASSSSTFSSSSSSYVSSKSKKASGSGSGSAFGSGDSTAWSNVPLATSTSSVSSASTSTNTSASVTNSVSGSGTWSAWADPSGTGTGTSTMPLVATYTGAAASNAVGPFGGVVVVLLAAVLTL